jgi:transcriptional regulator with XRE-family HTH domain
MGKKQTRQLTYEQMKEYGDYFRSVRKSLGYTIPEMADKLGIHHTTLYRWEKSKIIPQVDIKYLVTKYQNIVKVAKKVREMSI